MNINPNDLCMGCMSRMNIGDSVCRNCGYIIDSPFLPCYIAPKTVLRERYIIGKVIKYNGEGASYIAFDVVTLKKVVIREYIPDELATRARGELWVKINYGCESKYKSLLNDFIELSKELIKFRSIGGLVHPLEVFEDNGTAYTVYEYIEGITFSEYLKQNGGYLPWEELKQLFLPFLTTLSFLHEQQIFHRGISPETLMLDAGHKLLLTDFCVPAVRTARSEMVAELFAGYAAPEQYASSAWQGPHTDVYSVAAVIYRALTGTMPVDALSRSSNDNLISAHRLNKTVPLYISNVLSDAMKLTPNSRTQTVITFAAQLKDNLVFTEDQKPDATAFKAKKNETAAKTAKNEDKKPNTLVYALIAGGVSVIVLGALAFFLFSQLGLFGGSSSEMVFSSNSDIISSDVSDASSEMISSIFSEQQKNEVPSFKAQSLEEIQLNPDYSNVFVFEIVEDYSEDIKAGSVISQSVAPGTLYEDGDRVKIMLTVSKGSPKITLPEFKDKTVAYTREWLKENNLQYTIIAGTETGDPDYISGTDFPAGTELDVRTDKIVLYTYIPENTEIN